VDCLVRGRGGTLKKYQREIRGCFDLCRRCLLQGTSTTTPKPCCTISIMVLLMLLSG
jgi:hypothetical protein